MVHRKLSDKFKIIAAVLAVVVVAAAAVAYTALSSSGNDVQTALSAGQSRANDLGVTITSGDNSWSDTLDDAPIIGEYDIDPYDFVALEINSIVKVANGKSCEVTVKGKTFGGADIDDSRISAIGSDIYLTEAGVYTAEVIVGDDVANPVKLYAKVGKKQLSPTASCTDTVYNGSDKNLSVMREVAQSLPLDKILNFSEDKLYVAHTYFGETSPSGLAVDRLDDFASDNIRFSIKNAGTYAVYLEIKEGAYDNYEWDNADTNFTTCTFVLNQAEVSGRVSAEASYEYMPTLTVEELIGKVSYLFNGAAGNVCNAEIKLYTDNTYTTEVTELHRGQTIYAKAVKLTSKGTDENAYRNYRLPDNNSLTCSFKLSAKKLPSITVVNDYYYNNINLPENTNVTVSEDKTRITAPYFAFDYQISQWFYHSNTHTDNWTVPLEDKGHNQGEYWKVTLLTDSGEKVINPKTEKFRNAGTYRIKIEPLDDNYEFDGVTEYNITLTIQPFTLDSGYITWIDNHHVYSGEPIPMTNEDYILSLWNDGQLKNSTNGELELILSYGGDTEAPINAGKYGNYTVTGLKGEGTVNYKLPDVGGQSITNATHPFVIYKQRLPEFSGTPVVTGTFTGSEQSVDFGREFDRLHLGHYEDATDSEGNKIQNFVPGISPVNDIVRSYPQAWGLGNATFNDGAVISLMQYFDYTYAGSYTVSFAMQTTMAVNYCWYTSDSDDPDSPTTEYYTWTNFALINRAEINPKLDNSHLSVNDDDVKFNEIFNGTLVENGVIVYTLAYGDENSEHVSDTPLDKDGNGKYLAGEYYLLISINDEFYPSCYFKAPVEGDGYTVDGKQAKVTYIVSSNTASFSVKVAPYTFGANFASDFNTGKVFTVTTSVMEGVTYGAPAFAYYTDSSRTQTLEESAIINGVPRNAGKYYVTVTVICNFADDNSQTELTRNCELTVAKRQVTLAWTFDDSATDELSKVVTYNNAAHTVSVANTNTINGVTNVAITLDNTSATNASNTPYAFNVTGITGDEADNYTLVGVSNTSFTLTINRAQVTVTAKDVANITFGDTLTLPAPAFTITSGQFYNNEDNGKISVVVYNNSGNLVTESNYNKLSRGAYAALPVWDTASDTKPTLTDANSYTVTLDNYVVTMVASNFNVTSQAITVTLYGGASSVYGEAVDLYVEGTIYTVSPAMTKDEFVQLVEITAKKGQVNATDERAGIGEYQLSAKIIGDSGDYELTVKHNQGNKSVYTITPRALTVRAQSFEHRYGDVAKTEYEDAYTMDGLLNGDSIDISCIVYKFEQSAWTTKFLASESISTETRKHYLVPISSGVYVNFNSAMKQDEEGKYYYTVTVGNYAMTAYVGDFTIVPRAITLTFTNGSSTYGEQIDLWKQQSSGLSLAEKRYKYVYFVGGNLPLTYTDDIISDIINVVLADSSGNEYDPSTSIVNAGTYSFKATIKNDNYVIGEDRVTEFISADKQFVVNPKGITVTTSATASSIIYGNDLTGITLDFTVSELVNGDTKADLGIIVGIYDGETAIADISVQNVGDYKVGVSAPANGNYTVTSVTKANFSITKRSATVTAVNVTNHVYGEALGANELTFTPEARSATSGFVSDAHWQALGITPSVNGDASKFTVDGSYAISLSKASDNTNYDITLTPGTFTVVKRQITVTPGAVNEHVYGSSLGDTELSKTIARNNGTGDAIVNGDNLEIVLKVYDGETDVTNNVATLAVKTYTIKVEYKANANYDVTVSTADFKVVKLKATITFNQSASSVYGEAINSSDAYSITGLLSGDVGTEVVTIKNADGISASSASPVGAYTVIVTIDENYEVEYVNGDANNHGKYTINKRAVTVTATDVASHVYGEDYNTSSLAYTVAVTNGTGDAIVGSDNLDIVKGIYDGTTEITDVSQLNVKTGGYTIRLTKGASSNANYDVTLVNGAFTVVQREITVTFVTATKPIGSSNAYHTLYFADDSDSSIVDNTLYSNAVITLGAGELVNGATLRSVLSLTAVNGTHNATERHAPAGNYTITPTVIDNNYKLKNSAVTGVYVIGKAQLTMTSAYPIVTGTHGYTGAAQSIFNESVKYSSVNGEPVTVLYKVTTEEYNGTLDEAFFADGTTALPTRINVGVYYAYVLAKADDNHETAKLSVTFEIVPVTLTITAKSVELTYHDELPLSNWYEHNITTEATVTPYAGLNSNVLNTYLAKLTRETNYTTSTNAGATGITVTPVYDNGSSGDDNVIVNCVAGAVTVNKANITISSVTSGHASGAYTGEAFELFGTMSATTVNSQAITWYYREVGQSDSDWKLYNDDTLTDVCSKQYQVKAVANNHNDNIYATAIDFVISQNSITIKADNKDIVYGDSLSSVTLSGQLDGSANGLLTANLNSYINAAAATYSVNGYTTTTAAGSALDITSAYTGDANVQVTVTKGTLTVKTRELTVTFNNGKNSVYGVQVTDSVVKSLCSVSGLVNDEEATVTAKKGETNLTSSKAPAGTYTVTVAASDNYTIKYTNGASGTYEITKRVITATLVESSVTYTEDGSDYHNGVYGAAHNAVVTFGNLASGDNLSINSGYTLSYNTTESNGQAEGAAPTKAGEYEVTVTLSNANYTFADDKASVELGFEVTKKVIDASQLTWDKTSIEYIDYTKQDNYVNGYISAIMQVVSATKITAQQMQEDKESPKGTSLPLGDKNTGDCYYIDEDGVLHIVAYGRAEYSVIFKLNDDAQVNYKFIHLQAGAESVELAFYVINENITLTVNSAGWQYLDKVQGGKDDNGDDIDLMKLLLNVLINGEIPIYGLSYAYAPVKDGADIDALLQRKAAEDYGGFDEKDVSDAYDSLAALDFPKLDNKTFDVGYYIFCVTYDTFDHAAEDVFRTTKYDIVKVAPKQLNLPTTLESRPYNGSSQRINIDFNMSNNGTTESIRDLVTSKVGGAEYDYISGRNAGTYTAIITIKDIVHYVWADDMNANNNGEVTVTWQITKDTADNNSGTYFTVGSIADSIYGGTIIKTDPTAKSGYGSAFTWYFANKGSLTNVTEVLAWTEWNESDKPINVGDYFVKVILTDTSTGKINFTDKVGYGELTIGKATLHITLSGSLEYGNAFAQSYCNYTVVASDLINGDKASVVSATSGLSYYLVDNNGDQLTNLDKLEVSTYNLTVWTDESNYVIGLTADNYNIVLSDGYGVFSVTPKAINVTINANGASSQYGLAPVLTGVTATYTGVDSELVIAKVIENLYTEATATSGIGSNYVISSKYDENNENKNLDISYTVAYYTITARKIYVTLDASNAGGTYKGAIGQVTIAAVKDENGVDVSALVGNDYLTIVYDGTAFDGTAYAGNATHAGDSFTATVTGDVDNGNFAIVDAPVVSFAVNKIIVDSSKITSESQMYTGEGLDPTIIDKDYNVNGEKIYTVNYNKNTLVDVKTHYLTLELVDAYNYAWNSLDNASETATIEFVIAGAGIYAIPYAEVVYYGATYADVELALKYRLVYASGVNKGEDATADVKVVGSGVKFVFVDKDALNLDLDRLTAGKYSITLETINGFVVGLESTNTNYSNIALELNDDKQIVYGELEVKPRKITITVNSSSSVYSEEIDVKNNGFEVTDGELVFGEGKEVINFRITADTSSWINAGGNYVVTATATANNYEIVDVISGKHTINQLEVTVTVIAENGRYIDKAVEVTTTQTGNVAYDFAVNFATKYTFKYTNTVTGAESEIKPTKAGSYQVKVTSINDSNFKLVSSNTATFTIAKKIIDEDNINANQGLVYNGQNQSHGITAVTGEYSVSNGVYVNADTYKITLTLDDADNYTWKNTADVEVKKDFVIAQARLTLKPNGEITYGDSFETHVSMYGFELIGLVDADKGKDNYDIVNGTVTYALANDDGAKLNASDEGYDMIADISGLTCQNYRLTTEIGKLIVHKRSITIKPYPSQSVYGEAVTLSQDFEDVDNRIVAGDSKSDFHFEASTTATSASNVGSYEITATASHRNYIIAVEPNVMHTIVAAQISVRIRAINGTYGDDTARGGIAFVSVEVIHSDGTTEPINTLKFAVRYEGTANDLSYVDGYEVPTKAGIYTATVTEVLNDNYTLNASSLSSAMFEIFKCEIDAEKIKAISATYTGKDLQPKIEDNLYNVNGQHVYSTVTESKFIDAGVYEVILYLRDTDNYCWKDNLNRTTVIKYEIVKANNSLVDVNNPSAPASSVKVVISDWTFDGAVSVPQASVASGAQNIVFEYAKSENGEYTTEVPKNAGEYYVRATVAASENYNAFTSAPVKFVIGKKVVSLPVVTNLAANSVYTGSMLSLQVEGFDDQIMSLTLDKDMYRADNEGKLNLLALNANTYKAVFKLRDADNYEWENNSQTVDGGVVVNWTVERQVLKVLQSDGRKIVVNGEDIVYTPDGFNSGIMTIRDNVRAHEGKYSAVIVLKDKVNYAWEGIDGDTITVEFELVGTNTVFVALICVAAGLCVGLGAMALILILVQRSKKRKEAEAIDKRSRADGWEE